MPANRPRDEKEKNSGTPKLERQLPAPAKAAEEYRAKAFELMTANVNATLDYAQQLANVRSPAEFIALSANHARKHFELIMTHTAALGALSQSLDEDQHRTDDRRHRESVQPAKGLRNGSDRGLRQNVFLMPPGDMPPRRWLRRR